jgi:hypothetical protein
VAGCSVQLDFSDQGPRTRMSDPPADVSRDGDGTTGGGSPSFVGVRQDSPVNSNEYDVVAVEDSAFAPVHANKDEEDDDENPISDFEIVGLFGSNNWWSCNLHYVCGKQVEVGAGVG